MERADKAGKGKSWLGITSKASKPAKQSGVSLGAAFRLSLLGISFYPVQRKPAIKPQHT